MAEEIWENDLYEQLAAAGALHANPVAASLLETLDDARFRALRAAFLDDLHLYPGAVTLELGCGPGMLVEDLVARTGEESHRSPLHRRSTGSPPGMHDRWCETFLPARFYATTSAHLA